ncbi:MAG: DUF167 domain-containing protein [archaeon]
MKIDIKVKPNSGKQVVEKISNGDYRVFLKSTPENNKANVELVKLLNRYFGKEVKIKSGFSSRRKIIEVEDEI